MVKWEKEVSVFCKCFFQLIEVIEKYTAGISHLNKKVSFGFSHLIGRDIEGLQMNLYEANEQQN
jgi:hypothetical protein